LASARVISTFASSRWASGIFVFKSTFCPENYLTSPQAFLNHQEFLYKKLHRLRQRTLLTINRIEHQPSKAQLRRTLLKQRQSMSVEAWRLKSDRICSHLQSSSLFTQPQTVLAYFSFRQEPDLSPLFTDSKCYWGFSRVQGKFLCWHSWKPGDLLQTGGYGIPEPQADAPTLTSAEVDLILVPAVACDGRGYRLGYGGGFYDRLLSSAEWASKLTIGIVFEFAFVSQLPVDSWDRPLDAVCTETGIKITPS
jgi:5-formyltetrahydrofolate cyclo-ligase